MGPTPPTNPKAPKSTEGSSAVKAPGSGKTGGKVDSPVKTGRDEMMKVTAARSPSSKAPSATDVTIQKCVTGTSELVSTTVFNGTYPAHQFLGDPRNFFDINGRLFFPNITEQAVAPALPSDLGFLSPNGPRHTRPFFSFFYQTAVARGRAEFFDQIPDVLIQWYTDNTDASNGNRPFRIQEVTYILQEDEVDALARLAAAVTVA